MSFYFSRDEDSPALWTADLHEVFLENLEKCGVPIV